MAEGDGEKHSPFLPCGVGGRPACIVLPSTFCGRDRHVHLVEVSGSFLYHKLSLNPNISFSKY